MVSVSCEPGTSGAARTYESVVAFGRTHFPATGGESEGVTLPSATGAEKVIDNLVFVATFCAPVDGVEDVTSNATSDAGDDADDDEGRFESFESEVLPLCDGPE
jgi:hypothetical protein